MERPCSCSVPSILESDRGGDLRFTGDMSMTTYKNISYYNNTTDMNMISECDVDN